MVFVSIFCHENIKALQSRNEGLMLIKLVSLESVRIASDSFVLLRNLIDQRYWRCPQMDLLSLVAGVALELLKIKHDLFPLLVVQEVKLEGGFLKALLLLKSSAITLVLLVEDAKEIVKDRVGSLVEDDLLLGKVGKLGKEGKLGKVEEVGELIRLTVDEILMGARNFEWLQAGIPIWLDKVDALLANPVHFPDSQ